MNRDSINEIYKWDLQKIYKDEEEFRKDINLVKEKIDKFSNKEINKDNIYEEIKLYMDTSRILSKLEAYVSLLCDEDTSNNKNRELKEEIDNLNSNFIKKSYYIEVNILKLDYSYIKEIISNDNRLKEYKRYLELLFRYKDYTLSDKEEKIIANMCKVMGNNYESYELLKDSDMEFPNFIVDNKEYELNNSNYGKYMDSDIRDIRKHSFLTLYKIYKQYKNIFANLLCSNIKEEVTMSNIRGYNSSLEESTYKDEIDDKIYNNLIEVINNRLDVLHKYYELKKEVLKLDELHLYDVYANLIKGLDKEYKYEDSQNTVIEALSILGDEYIEILKKGLKDRWIDVYPNKGKRTGGYSSGCYDTNPYILLNYLNKYDDMSTLAHELGHSMHSYYTRKYNTYQDGHYTIFVAEVASTVNELLLAKYILNKSNDKEEKLFILNRMMELFRATIYRQTMFAEFERNIYNLIEEDKPVSADILCNNYYELNKRYFGKNVYIDEEIKYEWERIPHFYYNFYVYKYATGLSAACYIVDGLLNGRIKSEQYIEFLKCGMKKNPIDSLKLAGVNLEDKEVIEKAINMFESTINEFSDLYF